MAKAIDNLTTGPAAVHVDDVDLAHTQGGVTVNITAQNRVRNVDQYGSSALDVIHLGDEVRVTAPFAEWTAEVLAEIYDPGNDQTAASSTPYIGIGRSAGYVYSDNDLKIIPILTADVSKKIQFWRAVANGEMSIAHNTDDDRIFEIEFICMADPDGVNTSNSASDNDGELIGKIYIGS